MAKVFGSSQLCNSGGITRVLPTSSESLQTTQTQTFSSSPNIYSKSQPSSGDLNLRDFYNKSDIHRLLKLKADISSIYLKSDIDLRFSSLQSQFNASITEFITEPETDVKILNLYNTIISEIGNSYYQKFFLYTKSEVDSLLMAISLGDEFISLEPETTLRNTINPGGNNAVPLSIKASSNSNITTVQHWIDSQSNSIGRVRTSGRIEFYGDMILGQNVESWKPALDVNMRRISGVADPIHVFDAVNKKYAEDFISESITNLIAGLDIKIEGFEFISDGNQESKIQNKITSISITENNFSDVIITSFNSSRYRSAKFLIQISAFGTNTNYEISEILVVHNGTTAFLSQYGIINTQENSNKFGEFDALIVSSGECQLLFKKYSWVTENITIRVFQVAISV